MILNKKTKTFQPKTVKHFSEKSNTKIYKEMITTTVFSQHPNTSVRVCSYYFGRLVDSTIALIT